MSVVALAINKWKYILQAVGKLDESILDGKHHPCPINAKSTDRFRFSNRNGKGNYFCDCSDGSKDGFDLLRCCRGLEFKEAAKEVEEAIGGAKNDSDDQAKKVKSPAKIKEDIRRIVDSRVRIGREVTDYLANRGIHLSSREQFQARTYYGLYPYGITAPLHAMASILKNVKGNSEAIHLTYINDGRKADIPKQRIVTTPITGLRGCAVRLAPMGEDGKLGVGEGVESSYSAMQLYGMPVWATISANGMASFELPEGVKEFHIFADNDANYVGQAAAYSLARRVAAKADGPAVFVHVPEQVGFDYNNVLMGVA